MIKPFRATLPSYKITFLRQRFYFGRDANIIIYLRQIKYQGYSQSGEHKYKVF